MHGVSYDTHWYCREAEVAMVVAVATVVVVAAGMEGAEAEGMEEAVTPASP